VGDGVTFSSIFNFTTVYAKGTRTAPGWLLGHLWKLGTS
jgi:hypothetical protein